tara:strand:+ start:8342 stop:8617 length:276 start_codon:yes stop_codon:yes gene_type:complete
MNKETLKKQIYDKQTKNGFIQKLDVGFYGEIYRNFTTAPKYTNTSQDIRNIVKGFTGYSHNMDFQLMVLNMSEEIIEEINHEVLLRMANEK